MIKTFPLLLAAPFLLSGCLLTGNNNSAGVAPPVGGSLAAPAFALSFAQPGGSVDQSIVSEGITGFFSTAAGNQALRLQADASFSNLTVTLQDGTEIIVPLDALSSSNAGSGQSGNTIVGYTTKLSDHVSLREVSIEVGGTILTGFTALGLQTPLANMPRTGNQVFYSGDALIQTGVSNANTSYSMTLDFVAGTFTGTASSSNPIIGDLLTTGTIVDNRITGTATLTPLAAGQAPTTGPLDGGFFRDQGEVVGGVFSTSSADPTAIAAQGFILASD